MKQKTVDNQVIESGIVNLTIKQYSKAFGVSDTTTRTRVRKGQVTAYKQDSKWLIEIDRNQLPNLVGGFDLELTSESDTSIKLLDAKDKQISQLEASVEHLRSSLEQANERSSRQDAIIMKQTLMISGKGVSLWQRFKSLFGGVEAGI